MPAIAAARGVRIAFCRAINRWFTVAECKSASVYQQG